MNKQLSENFYAKEFISERNVVEKGEYVLQNEENNTEGERELKNRKKAFWRWVTSTF